MLRKLLQIIVFALSLSAGIAMAGPVNINTADAETLAAELVGVGEKTAAAIVAHRVEFGLFKSADDLKAVKGIGEAILEKNREYIRVD